MADQNGKNAEYAITSRVAVVDLLDRLGQQGVNWVILWVANCEYRQAEASFTVPQLHALVQKYRDYQIPLQRQIKTFVKHFEASGRECLCVKVLKIVDEYDPSNS